VDGLRPAIAPGEDRNGSNGCILRVINAGLRPAIAPGEDRNLIRAAQKIAYWIRLRPAIAPGEDRNQRSDLNAARSSLLRPAIAPGEDRNGGAGLVDRGLGARCARPSRRARIATGD